MTVRTSFAALSLWMAADFVNGFVPLSSRPLLFGVTPHRQPQHEYQRFMAAPDDSDDDEEEEEKKNPYQDENYPDLEFIDYSDPNYVVDQGISDEFFDSSSKDDTEEQIESMREDRRQRNDEYQFETYHAEVLKSGDEYKGEWTVYKTSTFLPGPESKKLDSNGLPRLVKARRTLKVISRGYKIEVPNTESDRRVDGWRICHEERAVSDKESDPYKEWQQDVDTDQGFGRYEDNDSSISPEKEFAALTAEAKQTEQEIMANTYWPEKMTPLDFRGHQGNMCVGDAYTICTSVPFDLSGVPHEGPFSELRTEVGLKYKQLRFRLKLDYSVKDAEKEAFEKKSTAVPPPLHLKSMTVCRETRELWPRDGKFRSVADRAVSDALFGQPGASGGLYDPPPVGSEEQATRYMMLDLEGAATVLFPYMLDQDPEAFEGNGWVTSLDWTPGTYRYQVDRKVQGGANLMGLRTLELSEVQGVDADQYRPRDGGQDMRQ